MTATARGMAAMSYAAPEAASTLIPQPQNVQSASVGAVILIDTCSQIEDYTW